MNNKIYIIGGLGSGKSFLAKELSKKTGIEYFNMDKIIFKEGSFEEKERSSIFENIVKKDRWIVEGTFTEDWILSGLRRSSQIIYLKTSPLVRLYRFIKRTLPEGISKQSDLLGRVKLVLGFRHKEWDRTSTKYEQLLEPFKDKVIILKSKKEIEDFLQAMEPLTINH